MGSGPADVMRLHAQHASSMSYSTEDLELQLHNASLQHSAAAACQHRAPCVPSDVPRLAPHTLPAGAAACGSMSPAALSAAPAEELLLWDRRQASVAATAVSRAVSLHVCMHAARDLHIGGTLPLKQAGHATVLARRHALSLPAQRDVQ